MSPVSCHFKIIFYVTLLITILIISTGFITNINSKVISPNSLLIKSKPIISISYPYDLFFDINSSKIYNRSKYCLPHIIHKPLKWPNHSEPNIILEYNSLKYSNYSIDYSIIYQIYDTINIANKIMESIFLVTRGNYELIIILDDCDYACKNLVVNKTLKYIKLLNTNPNLCNYDFVINKLSKLSKDNKRFVRQKTFLKKKKVCNNKWFNKCGNLIKVQILEAKPPGLFETSANNLGMCVSNGSILILLQDDMLMTQIGWNIELSLGMLLFPNHTFSTSARIATEDVLWWRKIKLGRRPRQMIQNLTKFKENHPYLQNYLFNDIRGGAIVGAKPGYIINHPLKKVMLKGMNLKLNEIYIRPHSPRGPLAINKQLIHKIGYLSERDYEMTHDDNELHLRMLNYFNGHVWSSYKVLEFRADLKWGGTRRKRREQSLEAKIFKRAFIAWRHERRDKFKNKLHKTFKMWRGKYKITFKKKDIQKLNVCI